MVHTMARLKNFQKFTGMSDLTIAKMRLLGLTYDQSIADGASHLFHTTERRPQQYWIEGPQNWEAIIARIADQMAARAAGVEAQSQPDWDPWMLCHLISRTTLL